MTQQERRYVLQVIDAAQELRIAMLWFSKVLPGMRVGKALDRWVLRTIGKVLAWYSRHLDRKYAAFAAEAQRRAANG